MVRDGFEEVKGGPYGHSVESEMWSGEKRGCKGGQGEATGSNMHVSQEWNPSLSHFFFIISKIVL